MLPCPRSRHIAIKVEAEYQVVLQTAEEIRQYWEDRNRERDRSIAATPLKKHGVDFIDACRIFYGCIVEYEDTRYNYGEQRFIAIGESNGRILTVVYTWQGEVIRLISARSATKNDFFRNQSASRRARRHV